MTARLQGRPALVTGSTDGIGAGIAHALADGGAYVVVSGRDAPRGEKYQRCSCYQITVQELPPTGG